ncbi:MAG: hypothetical protein WBD40_13875 [Tepidisphaeraceae bacterium]
MVVCRGRLARDATARPEVVSTPIIFIVSVRADGQRRIAHRHHPARQHAYGAHALAALGEVQEEVQVQPL